MTGRATGAILDAPTISVCVCTYRRPALLERLLGALAAQVDAPPFEIVVVDNDAARSAAEVLARASDRGLDLRVAVEPRQSIALARNATVRLARAAWLAFVDDDEEPVAHWLASLHRAAAGGRADGAAGPVVPRLPPGTPAWIVRAGLHDRPRHATGAPVPAGELRTGNLLVRREVLLRSAVADGPFDLRFGLSGGEDSMLFLGLVRGGARFVWCDEAAVFETIPPTRTRVRYLVESAFGAGHVYARLAVASHGRRAVPSLVMRGAGAVGVGAAMALASLPLGPHRAARWAQLAVTGAGKLLGIAGSRFERYARA
jgi:glycosyltransferase involved in cell wall biosynthesis